MADLEHSFDTIEARLHRAEAKVDQLTTELRLYQDMLQSHPDYICKSTADLRLAYANQAFYQRFAGQYKHGESSILDLMATTEREPYLQRLRTLSFAVPQMVSRVRLLDADSQFQWIEWKDTALFDDSQQIIGYQSSGHDITIEQVLEHDLKLHVAFLEQMQEIVAVSDVHGILIYINETGARAYGFDSPEEMIGTPATNYMNTKNVDADFRRFVERIQRCPWHGEVQVKRRDGTLLSVEQSAFIIREDERPIYLATISRDISAQHEAQAALKQSEERFSRIFSMMPISTLILSVETRQILEVNDEFVRASGFTREDVLGKRAADVNLLVEPFLIHTLIEKMNSDNIASNIETRFRVKSGAIRNALVSAALIDLDEQPCMAIAALDITDQYTQQLREQAMAGYLRAIMKIADELIIIQDQTTFEQRAVELMRESLAIERCAIFMIDEQGEFLRGTFGTDDQGNTTDEHHLKLPISRIEHALAFPSEIWAVSHESPLSYWDETTQSMQIVGKGWVVTTAIRVGDLLIGMIANDSKLTGSEVNQVQQEALAIYASLLGNIIERRRVEQEFRASNERYRIIVETTQEGIAWYDIQSRITYANDHFATMLGYQLDEILGMLLIDLVGENQRAEAEKQWRQRLAGQSGRYDLVLQHKNGGERWFSISASPIRDENGVLTGALAMYSDITERKRAENALKSAHDELEQRVLERTIELEEERNLLRTLIDSMPYNIYAKDLNHRFIIVNRTLAKVLGRSDAKEIIGKDDYLFYPKETADRFKESEQHIFQTGQALMNQEEYVLDGMNDIEWVLSNKVPLRNLRGELIGLVGIAHDITALKRAETILNQKVEDERMFQHYLRMLHEIMLDLNQIDDLDVFYRRVVEFGLQKLDFERMGMFLYDTEDNRAIGTYGTDPNGEIIDEHNLQFVLEPHGVMWNTLENPFQVYLEEENYPLSHFREIVGYGWNAGSALWQGNRNLGWIMVDNLIHKQPPHPIRMEVLAQYGILVGSMLARKQAEDALRRSEHLYRSVITSMTEGIIVQDGNGGFETCNPAAERILRLNAEQIAGKDRLPDHWQLIRADGTTLTRKDSNPFVALHTDGQAHRGLVAGIQLPDNKLIWINISSVPIYTENEDSPNLIVTTLNDITSSKLAEDALRESEAKYRQLVESMNAGVIILDPDSKLNYANDRFCEMFGTDRETILGKNLFQLVDDEQSSMLANEWNKWQQGIYSSYELDIRHKDGTPITMLINGTPMYDGKGVYVGGFAVTIDITAQKQAEATLLRALDRERELGQLKTQFVSTTSHEFRTPLATILTTTEMLLYYRDRYDADQIDLRLEKIRAQVSHLRQIMEEVLQLARIQARGMEYKPALNDLCQLCEEIVEEFNSSSQNRDRVRYKALQESVQMIYDPRLIRQIITNLISNALKYSPNGEVVDFSLEPDGDDICLIVQDYGMGIPPESVSHLFEPFYRAPNVENISGTGLGLPIVKEAVEIHGGTIKCTTALNQGTRFVVRLPYKALSLDQTES